MKEGLFPRQGVSVLKKSLSLLAGAAALAVAAVPAVGQSSGSLAPKKVSLTVTPKVDHGSPWTFKAKGKVTLPKGTCPPGTTDTTYCTPTPTKAKACKGSVRIRYKLGKQIIKSVTVDLSKKCTYSAKTSFESPSLSGKKLTVQARFLGNDVLKAKNSPKRKVTLAP
jgi:hypothetical protein